MSKQVMEQAIEAMLIKQRVTMWENDGDADKFNAAIAALKEAIKQEQPAVHLSDIYDQMCARKEAIKSSQQAAPDQTGEPVAWATF